MRRIDRQPVLGAAMDEERRHLCRRFRYLQIKLLTVGQTHRFQLKQDLMGAVVYVDEFSL